MSKILLDPKQHLDEWPAVPDGKFQLRSRCGDLDNLDISVGDAAFFREMCHDPEETGNNFVSSARDTFRLLTSYRPTTTHKKTE